jgi:cation diffusion facilitator CzcD-associated flavoprotein CzcO
VIGTIAIIGAGPYGLSLAAHLSARNIEHRIFGRPMLFWSQIAGAGGERYLKSYCFGTNISTPTKGYSFADYSRPRGLETFEPCSIGHFSAYGHWFQQRNVAWVEPVDVTTVARQANGFAVTLASEERFIASRVVIATGLACFDYMPPVLASLPLALATHTSGITSFAAYQGRDVAVIGAGQSALEAAALLHEAGARPQLLVRAQRLLWHRRISRTRSLWRRLRSPITGLGSGPTAWALTHFPGAVHRMPVTLRTRFTKDHLPAEGAWWLRDRVESRVPVHFATTVVGARAAAGRVALRLHDSRSDREQPLVVDHVIAGSGYVVDVERLGFLDRELRGAIQRHELAPALSAEFETSVPGLHFVGPASSMSFGPLFRFVVGADYAARTVSAGLAAQLSAS